MQKNLIPRFKPRAEPLCSSTKAFRRLARDRASLLSQFASIFMYQWDAPKAERQLQTLSLRRELLDDLIATRGVELGDLLKPEAVEAVSAELQHRAPDRRARTVEELALILEELGDLTTEEVLARSAGDGRAWLDELANQSRVIQVEIPTLRGGETRWVSAEIASDYRDLNAHADKVLARWLAHAGPVTRAAILDRYALPAERVDAVLNDLAARRDLVRGHFTPNPSADEFIDLFGQWEERYERGEYHGTAADAAEFPEFESCAAETTR